MVKKNVNYNILATSTNTHPTFFPKKQIIKDWNQDFFSLKKATFIGL